MGLAGQVARDSLLLSYVLCRRSQGLGPGPVLFLPIFYTVMEVKVPAPGLVFVLPTLSSVMEVE